MLIRLITSFWSRGHTHMECDSMHSAIKHAHKFTNILIHSMSVGNCNTHGENLNEMMARRNKPYSDMLDLKSLEEKICQNTKKTKTGGTINWLKIKWIRH